MNIITIKKPMIQRWYLPKSAVISVNNALIDNEKSNELTKPENCTDKRVFNFKNTSKNMTDTK